MGVKNSKVSNEIFKLVIKSFELGQVGWLKMNGTFKLQGGWVLGINRIEKMPFLPQKSYSFCRVGVELIFYLSPFKLCTGFPKKAPVSQCFSVNIQ